MIHSPSTKMQLPAEKDALKGRAQALQITQPHSVLQTVITGDYPEGTEQALFGMGCFWGVERLFWQQAGIYTTAVGYCAGFTKNPHYEEVCSGLTGHNEVVLVVYWPNKISYEQLVTLFWENHNPTQGMSQGNDSGTQYRSGIYCFSEQQKKQAQASLKQYQNNMAVSANGNVTSGLLEQNKSSASISTEIIEADNFYFAEEYHQQYLAKNPNGYCNMQSIHKTGLPKYSTYKSPNGNGC